MTQPVGLGPDERANAIDRLAAEDLDVLIIGGGVVGAGAALDAVTRGLQQRLAALLPHPLLSSVPPAELQALQQAAAQDLAADLAGGLAGRVRSRLARTLTLVNIAWFIGCILVVTAVSG